MKKRLISLLTVCAMIIAMAAGCGAAADTEKAVDTGKAADTENNAGGENAETAETTKTAEAETAETKKIAMIYQDLSTEFNIYFQDVLTARAEELGIELVEFDGQGETDRQLNQCENAIEQGVDALLFIPVDKSGCVPIIEKCNEAGIPVIGCNNITDNITDATAYVGANDIEAGTMEMEYMAELMGGKGNICIVHGPYGHSAEVARQEGIMQVLKKYPEIKILEENTANWDRTEAMELMENWIQKNGENINAVVCHSDDMGMGVVQAIQGAGLGGKIEVIGVDAILDALNAVKSGDMAATVFQDVYGQAEGAMDVTIKILNGEEVEHTNYVPFQLVTKDNVDEYLANFK